MRILYVEDDLKLQSQTAKFLRANKHKVITFTNTVDALTFAQAEQFDILLCDQRLEHSPSGLTLAAQVRNLYPACPIVMVSSFATIPEISRGYEVDVDAYVPRPIRLEELLEKLYDAVERRRTKFPPSEAQIAIGPLTIDQVQRTATWHGETLNLTPSEFKMLVTLASKPGNVISVPDLCRLIKGTTVDNQQARELLKQHIFGLRSKLKQNGQYPSPIVNVRGQGYKWDLQSRG